MITMDRERIMKRLAVLIGLHRENFGICNTLFEELKQGQQYIFVLSE